MADQNGGAQRSPQDDEAVLVSMASTQPCVPVVVLAPTAALLGKQITSGSPSGSEVRSQASAQSNRSALTERRKRRSEKGPRPWPDDRLYNHRSLFLFTLQNPFRQAIIRMIEWKHWDNKVIGVILCNTITLAMYDCFDTPQMRMCAPDELNTPAGPYGYCNKMTTGIYCPASTLASPIAS
jgi:hypothetical protein